MHGPLESVIKDTGDRYPALDAIEREAAKLIATVRVRNDLAEMSIGSEFLMPTRKHDASWLGLDPRGTRVGLDWIPFQTLRDMRGTRWLQMGVDPRTVQEKLGHKDLGTTMKDVEYEEDVADDQIRAALEAEKNAAEKSNAMGKTREKKVAEVVSANS